MNYYNRFPGDYLRDTLHLTLLEDGAYNRLLDIFYSTEKALPKNRDLMYRISRASSVEERAAIDHVIDLFFVETRWGFVNKRAQREIKLAQSRIKTARENGKHGGRPKKYTEPNGNPVGLRTETQPITQKKALHPPSTIPQQRELQNLKAPENSPAFEMPESAIVPLGLWGQFKQMRDKIRKPMTPHAADLIFRKLKDLKAQGHDPIQVVEQSIRNSWQDVFPIKQERTNGKQPGTDSTQDHVERLVRNAKVFGVDR